MEGREGGLQESQERSGEEGEPKKARERHRSRVAVEKQQSTAQHSTAQHSRGAHG